MEYCIYAIIDPRNDEIFYIGETDDLDRRRSEHIRGTEQHSGDVIKQMKLNGFVPLFTVLERRDDEESAMRCEIFWIEFGLARGWKLTNAQAFSGYHERRTARGKETKRLSMMKALRHIANGRRLDGGSKSSDGWSRRDTARLAGMVKSQMKPRSMADVLNRPVAEIEAKLAEL